MKPPGQIALLVVVVALGIPASASAGTYTWNLTMDFTSTGSGANPDHDQYGATPWSYASRPTFPPGANFAPLPNFDPNFGGLAGWGDSTSSPTRFVGINPTTLPIVNGTVTYPAGQAVLEPTSGTDVAVGWTSPLSQQESVNITGAINADDGGTCLTGTGTWSLVQGGTTLASGSGTGPISTSATVNPGATIYLDVAAGLAGGTCAYTSATLKIEDPQSVPPAPTLSTPGSGALITTGQPTFSGTADSGFGASGNVAVHVYRGSSASGTPIENLTATRSGSSFSVPASPALTDGTYTAQAEQSDRASPPDAGLSSPVTFTVHNAPPTLTLDSLGSKPLTTSTPLLTGVAGTTPGDSSAVAVLVYPGASTAGSLARTLGATEGAGGRFSVKVAPALPDGQYTAVAIQRNTSGTIGTSNAQTFSVKTHAPLVSLTSPAAGAHTTDAKPMLAGSAGTVFGDSNQISVALYAGRSIHGHGLGTLRLTARGALWSGRWRNALAPGIYTAQAKQGDDAGHLGLSAARTFRIVPEPGVIGSSVTLDSHRVAAVTVGCPALTGSVCAGTVLVTTTGSFQPIAGGPVGPLKLLFAYVRIPGGQVVTVKRSVPRPLMKALRGHRSVPLLVTVLLLDSSRHETDTTAQRTLK